MHVVAVAIEIVWWIAGSFHVKSTQKNDNPSGFSSNLVRSMHITWSHQILTTSVEYSWNYGHLKISILANFFDYISCTLTHITVVA